MRFIQIQCIANKRSRNIPGNDDLIPYTGPFTWLVLTWHGQMIQSGVLLWLARGDREVWDGVME